MHLQLLKSVNHLGDSNLIRNRSYGGSKIDDLDYWALQERIVLGEWGVWTVRKAAWWHWEVGQGDDQEVGKNA